MFINTFQPEFQGVIKNQPRSAIRCIKLSKTVDVVVSYYGRTIVPAFDSTITANFNEKFIGHVSKTPDFIYVLIKIEASTYGL